jgi:hypothetical protein
MLWSTFGGQGLPVTAFYDAQGKLVELSAGTLTQQQLQQHIKTNYGVDVVANDASKLASWRRWTRTRTTSCTARRGTAAEGG